MRSHCKSCGFSPSSFEIGKSFQVGKTCTKQKTASLCLSFLCGYTFISTNAQTRIRDVAAEERETRRDAEKNLREGIYPQMDSTPESRVNTPPSTPCDPKGPCTNLGPTWALKGLLHYAITWEPMYLLDGCLDLLGK